MIERGAGAIVNIGSAVAIGPGRGPYAERHSARTMYGATKAALERFTQGLAEEVHQHGIAVTSVSPSVGVPTEGTVYHGLSKSLDDPDGEAISTAPTSVVPTRVMIDAQGNLPQPELGDALIDFTLPRAGGGEITLSEVGGDKNTVLVFYRAFW